MSSAALYDDPRGKQLLQAAADNSDWSVVGVVPPPDAPLVNGPENVALYHTSSKTLVVIASSPGQPPQAHLRSKKWLLDDRGNTSHASSGPRTGIRWVARCTPDGCSAMPDWATHSLMWSRAQIFALPKFESDVGPVNTGPPAKVKLRDFEGVQYLITPTEAPVLPPPPPSLLPVNPPAVNPPGASPPVFNRVAVKHAPAKPSAGKASSDQPFAGKGPADKPQTSSRLPQPAEKSVATVGRTPPPPPLNATPRLDKRKTSTDKPPADKPFADRAPPAAEPQTSSRVPQPAKESVVTTNAAPSPLPLKGIPRLDKLKTSADKAPTEKVFADKPPTEKPLASKAPAVEPPMRSPTPQPTKKSLSSPDAHLPPSPKTAKTAAGSSPGGGSGSAAAVSILFDQQARLGWQAWQLVQTGSSGHRDGCVSDSYAEMCRFATLGGKVKQMVLAWEASQP